MTGVGRMGCYYKKAGRLEKKSFLRVGYLDTCSPLSNTNKKGR